LKPNPTSADLKVVEEGSGRAHLKIKKMKLLCLYFVAPALAMMSVSA
jgi:hypothetical protein